MEYDIEQIKAANPIENVIGERIQISKQGAEYRACCPFHDERTPSFSITPSNGMYYCFGCGAGGNVINFVMDYDGLDFRSACAKLSGQSIATGETVKREPPKKIDYYANILPVSPAPEVIKPNEITMIFNPKNIEETGIQEMKWKPVLVHPYTLPDGSVSHYVIRAIIRDKKITPTVFWCIRPDGSEGWTTYTQDSERPLYNLAEIYEKPDAQIVLVEGEKAADAGIKATADIEKIVFSCWPGGTKALDRVDWSPLQGRNVVIIPDKDRVGFDCAAEATRYIQQAGAKSIKYVMPLKGVQKGWDIADQDWGKGELLGWAKKYKSDIIDYSVIEDEQPKELKQKKNQPANTNSEPPPAPPPPPENRDNPEYSELISKHIIGEVLDVSDYPFRILGHFKNTRYYLPESTRQVVDLTPAQHSKNQLLSLAPMSFWLKKFGDPTDRDNTKKINWDMATNTLLAFSARRGLFNQHELLRGRGAWLDKGRAVLHLGQDVYVDGIHYSPQEVESNYIYEQSFDVGVPFIEAASDEEAGQLLEICEQLSWEVPLSAALLAGWCIIAPVCGILDWRPHIWITGPSGSGKSTVIKSIIGKMLGQIAIHAEGKSTEAGIRQMLGQDARPILFDEAEAEDDASAKRMQAVLDLARVASSGGVVVKGNQSGTGMSFSVRTCFCFSAINTSIKHFADESRISQLVLRKDISPMANEKYSVLEERIATTITEAYSAKMLARSIKYLPVLRDNCKTFTDAAAMVFHSRRIADQVGTLLAGVFLTASTKRVTLEAAKAWIESKDWREITTVAAASEFERLIGKLATIRIEVDHDSRERHKISLGEAIVIASGVDTKQSEADDRIKLDCEAELKRYGIKFDHGDVIIANSSEPLKKLLAGTPWQTAWPRVLREHEQAEAVGNTYFSPGIKSRGVKIPVECFWES